ncbi:hypothetical protein WH8501_23180 [Crocosphaera watsonii WH 8501]|uniref:Prevent-host-death protein n=4 Tax=Crocosphaera watsonii TaxID=263511 RepID=T2JLP2_CROWT|nr:MULTISPECIES: hypothetical protein [Crocosphaera]MCH2243837.1 hypothetical protein [Crocosphaera sp.]CCQ53450.1 hypothetical protein CWATWH8502_3684 [Crocosphaera watsonii WH 8502]CCQ66768.1 hypothetical protein CWATWH0402_1424 [Crocosphaera watsonii WH 0402]
MMIFKEIKDNIRYVTNEKGEKTDVLIPLELWKTIVVQLSESEEIEDSREEILNDLKQSLLDGKIGKTFPLEELWQETD